jgi:hypothetical protein
MMRKIGVKDKDGNARRTPIGQPIVWPLPCLPKERIQINCYFFVVNSINIKCRAHLPPIFQIGFVSTKDYVRGFAICMDFQLGQPIPEYGKQIFQWANSAEKDNPFAFHT